MTHRCVKCGRDYSAKAPEILKGCSCGSQVFLLIRNAAQASALGDTAWLGNELKQVVKKEGKPITLEIENIRMLEKGVFELDLKSLILSKDPIVVRDSHGVYYIKVPERNSSASALAEERE